MVFDSNRNHNQITSDLTNSTNNSNISTGISINTPAQQSTATGTLASTAASLITPSTLTTISPNITNKNTSVFDSICDLTNKNLIFFNNTTNNKEEKSDLISQDNNKMLLGTLGCDGAVVRQKQKHPNIQHRPTIHPHKRLNPLNLKTPENCVSSSKLVNCEQTILNATTPTSPGAVNQIYNNQNDSENTTYENHQTIESEATELDNNIKQIQDLIEKLNSEIFKNPRNCTRPPSEYLEIYNAFTERLHNLQIRKQKLETQNDLATNNNTNDNENNFFDNIINDTKEISSPLNSPNKSEESDQQMSKSSSNNSITNDAKKTPSNGPPRLKLDPKYTSSINGKTSPLLVHERPPNLDLPTDSSVSSSLPMSIINSNFIQTNGVNNTPLSHNSHSFNDINDAILAPVINGLNSTIIIAGKTPSVSSFSPPSSIATTPTYHTTSSSSFLRIYIGTSTAVIEKKCIPLQEVLYNRLKSRNLEVEKCIAYIKESYMKIEWDVEVSKILAENIVIAELSEENQHSFDKKSFTFRSCDSCKKRFLLNIYSCSKCDYIMCQRNECRSKSERIVCVPRRSTAIISTPTQAPFNKQDILDNNSRPDSPIRETAINISQQILPVNQLKVSPPSRDRSRSETELNMFEKSTESPRPFQKTAKVSLTVSTFPRKNSFNTTQNNGITGSINEESGSVIETVAVTPTNSVIVREPPTIPKTHHLLNKPSRRDSFNVWEIPFTEIKIDMSKKVGSGSFGIVHQGHAFFHGVVAVKFLNVQNPTPSQSNAFRNEVAILKSTRHDNILLFIGCILKPYLAIVTEWCPGSSLYRHIHVEEEYWEMNQLIDIAKQTATGMEYLHARDILHRDLKSNNIFLIPKETNNYRRERYNHHQFQKNGTNPFDMSFMNEDIDKWTVKIGDFGLATAKSTWTQSSAKTNQPTGSILWMAPEVITQKVQDPYTQKSDVYSFGVVLYELVTGHLPYSKKEQNMILFLVGAGRLKLNSEDARKETPKEIKDLIQICSEYDRNKRHDFVEINDKLKNVRPVKLKSKIQRSQSAPNISYSQEFSFITGHGFYDDDFYPGTPNLFNRGHLISPTTISPKFESSFNN